MILDHKIERITRDLKERSLSALNPEYGVVPSINDFLVECDKVKQRGTHTLHWEFESKFMQVEACWTDMKLLELAHRLRWFMRIREQVTNKYDI